MSEPKQSVDALSQARHELSKIRGYLLAGPWQHDLPCLAKIRMDELTAAHGRVAELDTALKRVRDILLCGPNDDVVGALSLQLDELEKKVIDRDHHIAELKRVRECDQARVNSFHNENGALANGLAYVTARLNAIKAALHIDDGEDSVAAAAHIFQRLTELREQRDRLGQEGVDYRAKVERLTHENDQLRRTCAAHKHLREDNESLRVALTEARYRAKDAQCAAEKHQQEIKNYETAYAGACRRADTNAKENVRLIGELIGEQRRNDSLTRRVKEVEKLHASTSGVEAALQREREITRDYEKVLCELRQDRHRLEDRVKLVEAEFQQALKDLYAAKDSATRIRDANASLYKRTQELESDIAQARSVHVVLANQVIALEAKVKP